MEEYVRPEIAGRRRHAYAITEEHAGSDPSVLQTKAVRDGDGWRITGEKWFVTTGDIADYFIVVADAEGHGLTSFLVDKNLAGVAEKRRPRFMHAFVFEHPEFTFDDVRVDDSKILGGLGGGLELTKEWFMDERLLIAARSLGGAERCLDVAFAYAIERRQFGSRIFDYQAVSFQLADCAVELQAARAMTYQVAWEIDRKEVDAKTLHAKSASREAVRVADGEPRRRPLRAGARRPRLHAGEPGRADLPRPPGRPHLGGHRRDPEADRRERARQARARRPVRLAGIRAAGLMSRISLETLRREQLLDAAIGLVASKGYEATTVRDIAAAADVATGTIAYWFASRDDLLRAALVEAARRFGRRLDDALATATTPLEELIAHAEVATPRTPAEIAAQVVWVEFWRQAQRDPELRALHERMYDSWRARIAGTVRDGRRRPGRSGPSTPTTGRAGSWPWPTGSRCTCSCTPARSPPTTWSASRASTSPPHCCA